MCTRRCVRERVRRPERIPGHTRREIPRMPVNAVEAATEVVAGWRSSRRLDSGDNPAGPLFPSGDYAEQEIAMIADEKTNGSNCTQGHARDSRRILCC